MRDLPKSFLYQERFEIILSKLFSSKLHKRVSIYQFVPRYREVQSREELQNVY